MEGISCTELVKENKNLVRTIEKRKGKIIDNWYDMTLLELLWKERKADLNGPIWIK